MTKEWSPISVRLDAETQERLRRLARESGQSVSFVVREAVAEYGAARESRGGAGDRPYDRLQHLLGAVSHETNRSERTGEKLRARLKATAHARRPR